MTAVFQPMNIALAADLKETSGVPAPQLKFGGDGGGGIFGTACMLSRSL